MSEEVFRAYLYAHQAHVQSTFQAYMRNLQFRQDRGGYRDAYGDLEMVNHDAALQRYDGHDCSYVLHAWDIAPDELQHCSYMLPSNSTGALSCRVCCMQVLFKLDFLEGYRPVNPGFDQLARGKDSHDPIQVELMAELLHRGADANQADETVSFCLQFVRVASAL